MVAVEEKGGRRGEETVRELKTSRVVGGDSKPQQTIQWVPVVSFWVPGERLFSSHHHAACIASRRVAFISALFFVFLPVVAGL